MVAAGHADPICLKLINPHLMTYKTRVCIEKTVITSIVNTENIAHTLVVSLGTTSACDIVKHKSFPQIITLVHMYNADPSTHMYITV